MTDEELIALADEMATLESELRKQTGWSGWAVECGLAAAAIRALVAERGK